MRLPPFALLAATLALFLVSGAPGRAAWDGNRVGPSFDCSTVKLQALSSLICDNDRLASIDLRFAEAYLAMRQQLGDDRGSGLRQEAIDFQTRVNQSCNLPTFGPISPADRPQTEVCVASLYMQKRAFWISHLSPLLQEEAERSPREHMELQAALARLGFMPSGTAIDGLFGPESRAAIQSWQTMIGHPATGAFTSAEVRLLSSNSNPAPAPPTAPSIGVADPRAEKAAEERRIALLKAETDKARAEAERDQAGAERARLEVELIHEKERQAKEIERQEAEQRRHVQEARGVQP